VKKQLPPNAPIQRVQATLNRTRELIRESKRLTLQSKALEDGFVSRKRRAQN
jgi:hypothetical protein